MSKSNISMCLLTENEKYSCGDCHLLNADGTRDPIRCYDSKCAISFEQDKYCPVCGRVGLKTVTSFWYCKKCGSKGYDKLERFIETWNSFAANCPFSLSELNQMLEDKEATLISCPICKCEDTLYIYEGVSNGFHEYLDGYCSFCKKKIEIIFDSEIKERVVFYKSKKVKIPKYPCTIDPSFSLEKSQGV